MASFNCGSFRISSGMRLATRRGARDPDAGLDVVPRPTKRFFGLEGGAGVGAGAASGIADGVKVEVDASG